MIAFGELGKLFSPFTPVLFNFLNMHCFQRKSPKEGVFGGPERLQEGESATDFEGIPGSVGT